MTVQGLLDERPAMVCRTRPFAVATEVSLYGVTTAVAVSFRSSAAYRPYWSALSGSFGCCLWQFLWKRASKDNEDHSLGYKAPHKLHDKRPIQVTGCHVIKGCLLRNQWEYEICTWVHKCNLWRGLWVWPQWEIRASVFNHLQKK